jgi:hypothetical protein
MLLCVLGFAHFSLTSFMLILPLKLRQFVGCNWAWLKLCWTLRFVAVLLYVIPDRWDPPRWWRGSRENCYKNNLVPSSEEACRAANIFSSSALVCQSHARLGWSNLSVPFLANDLQFVRESRFKCTSPFFLCSLLVHMVRSHSVLINWQRVHN